MKIKGFNEASSESLFLFLEEQEATKTYYRIGLEYLCEILGIEHMPSKDVEDTEEYKKCDKMELMEKAEAYAWYDKNTKVWKYMLQQFIVTEIYFDGYNNSEFPLHLFKSGKGFTAGFGKIFQNGIIDFIGEGQIEELHVSKHDATSIKKIRNKGYKLILSEKDYELLFSEVSRKKQIGGRISQTAVTEFFHKRFPKNSKYDEKSNGKELKKIFLASMNDSIIPALSKKEIQVVETFFQKIMGLNSGQNDFVQRNYLKIAECNLELILQEFETLLKKNPKEETWQRFFEKNIFIFDSRYIDFLSKFSVKTGRSAQPDFLVYDIYGHVDIYEIKKSDVDLLKYDSSHDNYYWSSDVSKAIAQLEKYIFNCSRNKNDIEATIKEEKGVDVKIIQPKGVLVIGNWDKLENDNMQRDFEILRSALKNIEIVLYDEMYKRLKNLKISSLKMN